MTEAQKTLPEPHAAAELIELYFQKGWTDGLPVVPPSRKSVKAMLDAAGFSNFSGLTAARPVHRYRCQSANRKVRGLL